MRSIGLEIRNVANRLKREIHKNFDFEIGRNTGLHAIMIGYIKKNSDRDIFQKDLENEFSMRRSTASRMLRLMEHNGVIARVPVKEDARLKKIVLTKKAITIFDEVNEIAMNMEKKISKDISKEELDVFFSVIDKIKKNLDEED